MPRVGLASLVNKSQNMAITFYKTQGGMFSFLHCVPKKQWKFEGRKGISFLTYIGVILFSFFFIHLVFFCLYFCVFFLFFFLHPAYEIRFTSDVRWRVSLRMGSIIVADFSRRKLVLKIYLSLPNSIYWFLKCNMSFFCSEFNLII